MDQRRYINPAEYLDLMELLQTFTTEVDRSKTKLNGLIGQGIVLYHYLAVPIFKEKHDTYLRIPFIGSMQGVLTMNTVDGSSVRVCNCSCEVFPTRSPEICKFCWFLNGPLVGLIWSSSELALNFSLYLSLYNNDS